MKKRTRCIRGLVRRSAQTRGIPREGRISSASCLTCVHMSCVCVCVDMFEKVIKNFLINISCENIYCLPLHLSSPWWRFSWGSNIEPGARCYTMLMLLPLAVSHLGPTSPAFRDKFGSLFYGDKISVSPSGLRKHHDDDDDGWKMMRKGSFEAMVNRMASKGFGAFPEAWSTGEGRTTFKREELRGLLGNFPEAAKTYGGGGEGEHESPLTGPRELTRVPGGKFRHGKTRNASVSRRLRSTQIPTLLPVRGKRASPLTMMIKLGC